jgi:arylsulfatase A-like enzyme
MKLKNTPITFCILSIIAMVGCTSSTVEQSKPNVLFILADDFGYHDMSSSGSTYYETPNLDKISKEGMTFTDGYAACQVCSPSRASIMSGKSPARHGITDWIGAKSGEDWRKTGRFNKLLPAEYNHNLEKKYITLPEAMKEAGYKTFFAGKWHLGEEGSWPTDHGFDINKGGWTLGSPSGGYYSPWENPNLDNIKDGENLSMRLAEETVTFMKQHKDSSFFAFLSFYAVHGPIQTTEAKWKKYRDKAAVNGIDSTGFEMAKYLPVRTKQDNPIYAGLVESMDDAIGKVLSSLEEMGLDKNTIVIFTSDNGGVASGDAFATSNLPLRGGKGVQYEGGIREPYFIKVPWLEGGQKNSTPVTGTDFYPTILELIGENPKPEEHSDGISLVPLLEGKTLNERPLYWHYPHYGNQGGEPSSIVRLGDWKLIHYYEDGREELYNLKNDLYETTDVIKNNKELASQLSETLFTYLKSVNANFPQKDPEYKVELENKYLDKIKNQRWPNLEKQRLQFLSEDFDPRNKWWGSKVTND